MACCVATRGHTRVFKICWLCNVHNYRSFTASSMSCLLWDIRALTFSFLGSGPTQCRLLQTFQGVVNSGFEKVPFYFGFSLPVFWVFFSFPNLLFFGFVFLCSFPKYMLNYFIYKINISIYTLIFFKCILNFF